MKKILALLVVGFWMQLAMAADNPYALNYKAQNNNNLHSMQATPDTQIFAGTKKSEDNIRMLEDGYDLMGAAEFESHRVMPDLALQYGKEIRADRVLVYGDLAAQQMSISSLHLIKEAAKTTHEIDPEVLKQQSDEESYRYYASYWAKLPTPILGVHVIKLKPAGEGAQPLDGLKVLAVIKDSPAAKAGIQRGDQLLAINQTPLQDPAELSEQVRHFKGQQVSLKILRDDEEKTLNARLN
jgi:hypothetical protein